MKNKVWNYLLAIIVILAIIGITYLIVVPRPVCNIVKNYSDVLDSYFPNGYESEVEWKSAYKSGDDTGYRYEVYELKYYNNNIQREDTWSISTNSIKASNKEPDVFMQEQIWEKIRQEAINLIIRDTSSIKGTEYILERNFEIECDTKMEDLFNNPAELDFGHITFQSLERLGNVKMSLHLYSHTLDYDEVKEIGDKMIEKLNNSVDGLNIKFECIIDEK